MPLTSSRLVKQGKNAEPTTTDLLQRGPLPYDWTYDNMDYLLEDSNVATMFAGSYDSRVNVTDAQLLYEEGRDIF